MCGWFLGSLTVALAYYVYFYAKTMLFTTVALEYILKLGNLMPSAFFYLLKIIMIKEIFKVFPKEYDISYRDLIYSLHHVKVISFYF